MYRHLRRLTLCFAAILVLAAAPASAQTSTTVTVTDGGSYTVELVSRTVDQLNNRTTFEYKVTEKSGKSLSNWMLELCMFGPGVKEKNILYSYSPKDGAEVKIDEVDPLHGLFGIKWNVGDGFTSGIFTITLNGIWPLGPATVGVKTGGRVKLASGTIAGPDCDLGVCSPNTIPFWDGNMHLGPAAGQPAGEGYFFVHFPNGFTSAELDASSDNIALTGIVKTDETNTSAETVSAGLSFSGPLSGSVGSGYSRITYSGDAPLEYVRIQVAALNKSNSTFMFRLGDQCLFSGQMDPQLQLFASYRFELKQNFPNPFSPKTTVGFELPEDADVRLVVFDMLGREVKVLAAGSFAQGYHEATWDGTDAGGNPVANGTYLYRLKAGDHTQVKRMTLIR